MKQNKSTEGFKIGANNCKNIYPNIVSAYQIERRDNFVLRMSVCAAVFLYSAHRQYVFTKV